MNPRKHLLAQSKSTIETKEKGVIVANFEYIPHFFLVFLLLTLNKSMLVGNVMPGTMIWYFELFINNKLKFEMKCVTET